MTRFTLVSAMLASGLAFGLFACDSPDGSKTEVLDRTDRPELDFAVHPAGAMAPIGLEQLKYGMPQLEVLQILGARYKVIHSAIANANVGPIADYFQYAKSGQMKWAEIHYTEEGRVHAIYFGYEDTQKLE